LGLEEIGERFGGVYANAVKYNTFYIHHPGGASSARFYGAGDSSDPARIGTGVRDPFGELKVLADFVIFRFTNKDIVFDCIVCFMFV